MAVDFKSTRIACGLLEGWHHTPTFNEIEYHEDAELFYFLEVPRFNAVCGYQGWQSGHGIRSGLSDPAGTELSIDPARAILSR